MTKLSRNWKSFLNISFLLSFLTASFGAFGAEDPPTPKSIPELQTAIEKILHETKTPGAGIAIVSRDQAEWIASLGLADVATHQPATAETLFRIGSTSKAFAALAALQLQEQGKLKLTDTVHQWVPDVAFTNPWEATDPVRLVHLMEHTSGFDDLRPREYAQSDPTPISLKDALAFGAASRVCRWRPGSRMAYCNSGPAVLAAVIEKVTGERFEDYVQEHFFNSLHMDTASYFYTPAVQQHSATLYHSDGITPYPYWHISYRPAGAINASPKDMANYIQFYLQRGSFDGKQLLQPASIERMETPETLPSAKLGPIAGYGLYNYETLEDAFIFHGHGGAMPGGLTDMAYLPDYGRGYAIMINSEKRGALLRISKLLRKYIIRDLTPPPPPPTATVPAEVPQHYHGYYEEISPRVQMDYGVERLLACGWVGFTTNGISIIGPRFERLVPVTDRLYRKTNESVATLALLPDRDGDKLIQFGTTTFKQVPGWQIWAQVLDTVTTLSVMVGSVASVLIWVVRKWRGKLPNAGPFSLRLMPSISALFFGAFWALLILNGHSLTALGTPSAVSISIMLSSIAFALSATTGLYLVIRHRRTPMGRFAYWRRALAAAIIFIAAIYMACWGFIGLRLWT